MLKNVQILDHLLNTHHFLGSSAFTAKQHLEAFARGLLSVDVYNAARQPFAIQRLKLFLREKYNGLGSGVQALVPPCRAHARQHILETVVSQASFRGVP